MKGLPIKGKRGHGLEGFPSSATTGLCSDLCPLAQFQ